MRRRNLLLFSKVSYHLADNWSCDHCSYTGDMAGYWSSGYFAYDDFLN